MVSALVDMDGGLVSALVVIGGLLVVIIGLLIARAAMHGTHRKSSWQG
jgi:hypothetical protein